MHEQPEQEAQVDVGQRNDGVFETGRQRPHRRQQQFRRVVEVSTDTPVAVHQQEGSAFVAAAARRREARANHSSATAPNRAFAVGAANVDLLTVGEVVDDDGGGSDGESGAGGRSTHARGVFDQVEAGGGVQTRN